MRLELVVTGRETLRLAYDADLPPGVIREDRPNLEVWRREAGKDVFLTFLNHESDELLVPEEQLLSVAEGLSIKPARDLLESVKARGGLWLGQTPGD
ncbi:MAG: hypothetical protein ACC662_01635 [Planctomycetota bacterium]